MREVTASAPGKVNLILRTGASTPDGYHPLVSVFEALNVRETVTVRTARAPGIRVSTRAHHPDGSLDYETSRALDDLPPDHHLAVRAAKLLQRLAATGPWGRTAAGLEIDIDKRIPMAGGMAGGSADAAATLVAGTRLWGLELGPDQLEHLGRSLGADVPACLMGGIALGVGRGDHMRLVRPGLASIDEGGADSPARHWVLALAHEGLSTPEVFHALDAHGGPQGHWLPLTEPDAETIARLTSTASSLAGALVNDLTPAALTLRPELERPLSAAREAGALDVILSGSGPTIAALARDEAHAHALAQSLRNCEGVADVLTTWGPAQGARIEDEEEVN